jgi:hypothetical protein
MQLSLTQLPIQVYIAFAVGLVVWFWLKKRSTGPSQPDRKYQRSLHASSTTYGNYRYPERKPSNGLELVLLILALIVVIYFAWPFISKSVHLPSIQNVTQQVTGKTSSVVHDHQYYVNLAEHDADAAGIRPVVFVNMIREESNFDPHAVSKAGAEGIAQFMPQTAKGLGIDPWNPEQALQGAAHLIARYLLRYHGDYAKALAAYNAGPGRVDAAIQQGGSSWRAFLPIETQHYISRLFAILRGFL